MLPRGRQGTVSVLQAPTACWPRRPSRWTPIRSLRSAQVSPDELSAVLLVGGSSRIPLVARMLSEQLGRPTVVDAHPKYVVALGAATHAHLAVQ
ncbi:MAG TPA: Hsp70 family protein [Pseudonocardia sp.]|nr:Hsp70 family protein [Pseudonocardia sp.]